MLNKSILNKEVIAMLGYKFIALRLPKLFGSVRKKIEVQEPIRLSLSSDPVARKAVLSEILKNMYR